MKKRMDEKDRWLPMMRAAHQGKETAGPPDRWARDVMRRVRTLPGKRALPSPALALERNFWKMAPAALALVMACLLALAWMNPARETDVMDLLAGEAESMTLTLAMAE
ncbi:MAG: hypothetical protein KKA60_07385 [Proteobacteria bacterium]|nr:hypothetical protein [Pseudomonadota bacterium]